MNTAECKTPGATYHIRITARGINAGVSLPRGVQIRGLLDDMLPPEVQDRPDRPGIRKEYENIIHDALENAVAEIIELNSR